MSAPPVIYDRANSISVTLVPNQATDVLSGKITDDTAGSYGLKLTNDTDAAISLDAVLYAANNAVTPAKAHPAVTIKPRKSGLLMPIPLGVGASLTLKASGALSVVVFGMKGA